MQIKKIIQNYKKRAEIEMLLKYKQVNIDIMNAKKEKYGKRKAKTTMDKQEIDRLLP